MRLLLAVLCAAVAPMSALAAEVPALDWTGFYLGGHAGGAFGESNWVDLGAGPIGSHNPDGFIGGGQAGYNFQTGPWVFGPEVSLSGSTVGGRHLDAIFQFGPATEYDVGSADLFGAVTGRLGYSWGEWLFYGKAGIAWADTRYSLSGFFAPGLEFAVGHQTKWGPTGGAGIEYAFDRHWSGFLEYNYLGLGTDVATLGCTAVPDCGPPGAGNIKIRLRENFSMVKTGLNFRF